MTRNYDWLIQGEHYVAQKYLHKPLLIDGLKFDLRIYFLITGVWPLRCFIYKEGLARFATELYQSPLGRNLSNLQMHLTNYAINKEAEGFQQNKDATKDDEGHKRSLTSIFKYIDTHRDSKNGWPTSTALWQEIKDIFVKTILSGIHEIEHIYKSSKPSDLDNSLCFQLLGADIFLDSNCKPWLLEVNHSPSFATDSPLDFNIKKNMIRDTLHLLNLNQKRKQKCVHELRDENERRLVQNQRSKKDTVATALRNKEREELRQQRLQQKDLFETCNMGDFQNLYPLPRGICDEYDKKMDFYDNIYFKISKQAHQERNS